MHSLQTLIFINNDRLIKNVYTSKIIIDIDLNLSCMLIFSEKIKVLITLRRWN